jgi:hypothetical protein
VAKKEVRGVREAQAAKAELAPRARPHKTMALVTPVIATLGMASVVVVETAGPEVSEVEVAVAAQAEKSPYPSGPLAHIFR